MNVETGEKVAEWSSDRVRPEQFAVVVKDLAEWFHGATVNFENQGPGATFRKVLIEELGYTRVYLRRKDKGLAQEILAEPGVYMTADFKRGTLESYRAALSSGRFLNRSARALEECLEFVFDRGIVKHSKERVKDDHAGAGVNHGDQVIADALAYLILDEQGVRQPGGQEQHRDPPYGSHAWMEKTYAAVEDEWDGWGE